MLPIGAVAVLATLYYETNKAKSLLDKERDITLLAQQVNAYLKGRGTCIQQGINPETTFDFDPKKKSMCVKSGVYVNFDRADAILNEKKSAYNEARQNSLFGRIFKMGYNVHY